MNFSKILNVLILTKSDAGKIYYKRLKKKTFRAISWVPYQTDNV